MAYTSGTATDYKDLMTLLATFAGSNGWTILEQTTDRLYMCGVGLASLDQIYCGIECFESTGVYYNWKLVGSWSWVSGRAVDAHPMSSALKYAYLWNGSIPYWFIVNPRRIIVVAKVSTVYQMIYLGLGTPVGTDKQYPYPLIIGGCGFTAAQAYTVSNVNNTMFWSNINNSGLINRPGGDWDTIGPAYCPAYNVDYEERAYVYPDYSGNYLLQQIYIADANRPAIYANLDGIFRVSGAGNSSENIVTVSSENYLVVQDVYRTTVGDFCAVKLA